MKHLKITPDSRLNNQHAERLPQSLYNFRNMFERWNGRGFNRPQFFSFETVLAKKDTTFILTVPDNQVSVATKAIESAWSKVAVEEVQEPFTKTPQLASEIEMKNHYMFAIKVDKRTNGALESLLETLNAMDYDDRVYIQTVAVPCHHDWYEGAVEAYKRFKDGEMPAKIQVNKKLAGRMVLKGLTKTVLTACDLVLELTGNEPDEHKLNQAERAVILRDGQLRKETIQKPRAEAFDVTIRVVIACKEEARARALLRMVTTSFRELDGDNQLIDHEVNAEKAFVRLKERKGGVKIQKDYYSIPELSRLTLLPSGALQEEYDIPHIGKMEIDVPDQLLKSGMLLGHHERKGRFQNVYYPVSNWDEICLPCAIVGGMGQGKTKGYGANKIVEAVKNGFGALAIDPAKGELGDEIAKVLKPEEIIRYNLGETPIAIDWRETRHATRSRNRLANTILSFFDGDDTGGQTTRFLRASVFGMQTMNIKELLRMFEDVDYLQECVKRMPESIHKTTLANLSEYGDARRRQILDPLYNRLDDIMGDEYLAECFESEEGLDMVELMSQKKAIIIDIPKSLVGDIGVNLIGNLIMTKIDLAMTLRKEENQFPFFVVVDEPHQFTRSQKVWKNACVESRKWRVGYNFMFHDWVQLDRDLRDIIKSAGVNYHLYPSSKKTFLSLAEEIAPFGIEDALKMPSHHAINIIRSGGQQIKPFMLKMTKPPSKQS